MRTGRHCIVVVHAHLVFVAKYRHGVFTDMKGAGPPGGGSALAVALRGGVGFTSGMEAGALPTISVAPHRRAAAPGARTGNVIAGR
ncbi:hypothetical protein GCM10027570_51110 [Streptomonospora sediminis]